MDGRHYAIVAGCACLSYLVLALITSQGLRLETPDTIYSMLVARSLVAGNGFTIDAIILHPGPYEAVRHIPELHGLLRPLSLAALFQLFEPSPELARVPGILFNAGTAWVVFLIGRRSFGPAAGLAATLLTLASSHQLALALTGVDDTGFTFFFVATVNFLQRAFRSGSAALFLVAGMAAALAVLEKPLGFFLPGLIVAWPFCLRRGSRTSALLFVLPVLAAMSLYFARNWLAYGDAMFRFGGLQWLTRIVGLEASFRVHEVVPSLGDIAAEFGWSEIFGLMWLELEHVGLTFLGLTVQDPTRVLFAFLAPHAAFVPVERTLWFLIVASGWVALIARISRAPVLRTLFLLCLLGSAAFIGFFWHYQPRFLAFLLPLWSVWAASLIRTGAGADRPWERAGRVFAVGLVAVGILQIGSAIRAVEAAPRQAEGLCGPVMVWLSRHADESDRVLAFRPARVAWATNREAIVIPDGGLEALTTIQDRYDARWILISPHPTRPEGYRATRDLIARGIIADPEPSARNGACSVHRLNASFADAP